jgi:hypothetical protein
MSVYSGPEISNDGLIMLLDAANPKSYPGTGTTWTDLTGNGNNGVITGSVPYSDLFGGVFVFPGTIGNYINVTSPDLRTSDNTIIVASRYVTAAGTGRILSGLSNNWLLGHHSSGNTRGDYYAVGWVNLPSTTAGSDWGIYAGTGKISTDTWQLYDNGNLIVSNNAGSQGPNGFGIGRYAPGNSEYSNAYVGFVMAYNRVLTATEVSQVFQAYRGRFDI